MRKLLLSVGVIVLIGGGLWLSRATPAPQVIELPQSIPAVSTPAAPVAAAQPTVATPAAATPVDCGDENCFAKNFAACESATLTASISFASFSYRILGPKTHGCQMTVKYAKNPNPAWVNKEMTCVFDNTISLKASVEKALNEIVAGTLVCEGPLYSLLKGQ